VVSSVAGCGGEVTIFPGSTTSLGSGGTPIVTTSTTPTPPPPGPLGISKVNAPDETTVQVIFSGEPNEQAQLDSALSYTLDSTMGGLEILELSYDAAKKTATITTSKQKLGIYYEIAIQTGSDEVGILDGKFPSADTAKFWASDFGSPTYEAYQLVANRTELGEQGVMYVEQGFSPYGTGSAMSFFDNKIYPVETELLTKPGDIDGNGKIVLLGLDGGNYYGGYFTPINNIPDKQAQEYGYHSNEMEMVYINVAQGDFNAEVVLAHEFSHLLYHEKHGFAAEWEYHNEGLAECAVNAVNGDHPYSLMYLIQDPVAASGISLLDWKFGNYSYYAMSYMFLSYVAGQMGGVEGYGKLFDANGHPKGMNSLLQTELGMTFTQAQLNALVAAWAQAPSGKYSFEGMLKWPGKPPTGKPTSLKPLAGTWLQLDKATIDYSGSQGPDIVYVGIDGAGNVDTEAPFELGKGVLVAFNSKFEWKNLSPQPIGQLLPPMGKTPPKLDKKTRDPSWLHPPPLQLDNLARMNAWREATRPVPQ